MQGHGFRLRCLSSAGALKIETDDGRKTLAEMKHGVPYFRNVGVEHDVISANDFECAFVEIEFLDKKAN